MVENIQLLHRWLGGLTSESKYNFFITYVNCTPAAGGAKILNKSMALFTSVTTHNIPKFIQ